MILDEHIFKRGGNQNFLFGVKVLNGTLHKGTPIFAQNEKEVVELGKVISIIHHKGKTEKTLDIAEKGLTVCVQIDNDNNKSLGRHFSHENKLFSKNKQKCYRNTKKRL